MIDAEQSNAEQSIALKKKTIAYVERTTPIVWFNVERLIEGLPKNYGPGKFVVPMRLVYVVLSVNECERLLHMVSEHKQIEKITFWITTEEFVGEDCPVTCPHVIAVHLDRPPAKEAVSDKQLDGTSIASSVSLSVDEVMSLLPHRRPTL
jgi:hypothetical protein